MKFILTTLLIASTVGALKNLVDLSAARSNRLHHLLKDGPINAKKLIEKPSLTETTAHLARLLKKGEQMNDHHEVGEEEFGSGSGSGSGTGPDPETDCSDCIGPCDTKNQASFENIEGS